jgi:hypothetical protein
MVSDCLQQNWRMIQRWIRWSLGGHQWFVVSTAALRSVQDEGAQRAHHDEVSGREGGRCHPMSPGCEVSWWAPVSSDSWIFIPHSYGQSFLIHAKYGTVGMIITEHWDPDLYFGILKFISIYFKLVPGTTVPTEGLP